MKTQTLVFETLCPYIALTDLERAFLNHPTIRAENHIIMNRLDYFLTAHSQKNGKRGEVVIVKVDYVRPDFSDEFSEPKIDFEIKNLAGKVVVEKTFCHSSY